MMDHRQIGWRTALGTWAGGIVREIGEAFSVLARLQYDEPWKRVDTGPRARAARTRAID